MKIKIVFALVLAASASLKAMQLFVINEAGAKPCDIHEGTGLRHVSVLGHVERPGVYFFRDKIALYKLIELAGISPYRDGYETDLSKIQLVEASDDRRLLAPKIINVSRLIKLERRDELWVLTGGEVVAVPWLMR